MGQLNSWNNDVHTCDRAKVLTKIWEASSWSVKAQIGVSTSLKATRLEQAAPAFVETRPSDEYGELPHSKKGWDIGRGVPTGMKEESTMHGDI
jgi:hypothetical protein